MSQRSRRARGGVRFVAFVVPLAVLAPLACADSGDEAGRPQEPTPDAAVLPEAAVGDEASVDAGASSDAAPAAARCSKGGFCYEALPAPVPLAAVSGTSMDDVWAVGGDTIVRWDGASWKVAHRHDALASGTQVSLRAVFAGKTNDVWAVGETPFPERNYFFVRYAAADGGAPAFRELPTEEPVTADFWSGWLTPASDALWFIGAGSSSVLRFRETPEGTMAVDRWMPQGEVDDGTFYAWYGLWGFAADDIHVVGSACTFGSCENLVARYDGASWTVTRLDEPKLVTGMFGTRDPAQPRQLWLELMDPFSAERAIRLVPLASDGSLGSPIVERSIAGCGSLVGSAAGPGAAWLSDGCLVHRWNGTSLDVIPIAVGGEPPGRVNALWAASAEEAWVTGTSLPYKGPNLPELGFAARRKAADGGAP